MNFFVFGLNHTTSTVEERERFTLSNTAVEEFVSLCRNELKIGELLCLSTCNRTEFYGTYDKGEPPFEDIKKALCDYKKVDNPFVERTKFYYHEDDSAVRHLFRVSAGIDSMVIGEAQILGQVKEAYTLSTKMGSNGPIINKIFHQAFRVGKRARTETAVGQGIVSVSHSAVELAKKIFSSVNGKKVLLVGAGETGELAMKHFLKEGIDKIFLSNRSTEKAKELSSSLGGSVVPFEEFRSFICKVDIAVFSTSAEKFILTAKEMEELYQTPRLEPLFIIDISVPRNVDPAISSMDNVFLYDIDDLKSVVEENAKLRQGEIKKVDRIIDQEIKKYREWRGSLEFEPLLKFLKEEFERIRKEEIEKNASRFAGKVEDVDALTRSIVNKIANRPLQKLRKFNINTHSYILRSSLLEELFKDEEGE